uniref:Uncharacterized protein n=1 Tax=Anguilla anguilla TaxID=7936 RepID=A0A0E9XEV0_ANGAN
MIELKLSSERRRGLIEEVFLVRCDLTVAYSNYFISHCHFNRFILQNKTYKKVED